MKHHRMIGVALRSAMVATVALTGAMNVLDACAQRIATTNAQAKAEDDAPRERSTDIGQATHAWLDLQRSNAAAAPALPTPGAQASLAFERYMNSFRTRIPASFGSALSGANNAGPVGYSNAGAGQPSGAN